MIDYSFQLLLILYPLRCRETISLRGPVFHRSHGHNLIRPGHQSEVNYGYVSKICRKFTRTQRHHITPLEDFRLSQYSFVFFVHLVFCAHLFCTSYCFFAHLIVLHFFLFHCTFYSLFLLFLPYVCPCVMLLYIICIILHCPLSGPDLITFHF